MGAGKLAAAMLLSLPGLVSVAFGHAAAPRAARLAPRARRAAPVALTVSDLMSSLVGLRALSSMPLPGVVGLPRFASSSPPPHPPRILPDGGARLNLTESEAELFAFLREVAAESGCKTVMRVAGGWVRDKLLGRRCYDIDIALDNMTGLSFANAIRAALEARGEDLLHIGVIQANPEQSKHLETVAINLHGFSIDLVNLRSEEYSSESRIPSGVRFGSPLSDAARRDLTINSLFYNLHTDALEDMTGRALLDLQARRIDTPLEPLETLLDDPLRVLRAVRFGARFDYAIAPRLSGAMMDPSVQARLASKISRERVLRELAAMVDATGAAPVRAFRLIHDLRLHEAIFLAEQSFGAEQGGFGGVAPAGAAGGAAGAKAAAGAGVAANGAAGAEGSGATASAAGGAVERAARAHEASRALRAGTGRIEALHALLAESEGPCAEALAGSAAWRAAGAPSAAPRGAERGGEEEEGAPRGAWAGGTGDDGPSGAGAAPLGCDTTVGLDKLLLSIRQVHADRAERFRVWVATALLPLCECAADGSGARAARACTAGVGGAAGGAGGVRRGGSSLLEGVMRQGLRGMTSHDVSAVQRMLLYTDEFDRRLAPLIGAAASGAAGASAPGADAPAGSPLALSRKELGLLVRGAGKHWRSHMQLALVRALPPLQPAPSAEATAAWRQADGTRAVLGAYAALSKAIHSHGLEDAWQLGPLLDGNELMALGVPKGRAVGAALAELIEWQLEHKEAGRDDARRFLQARLGERAP